MPAGRGLRDTARVVSYNVHACIGRDGLFRPERIAGILRPLDADFIALQELQDREFGGTTVSAFLARQLDMHSYAGPTLDRGPDAYGNLLLAREPAVTYRTHDLSVPGREPRGAIEADFGSENRRLRMFTVHFGLSGAERRMQIGMLLPFVRRTGTDIRVLAGDVNEWRPAAFTLNTLRRVFGRAPRRRTFPARRPLLALDRIYAAPNSAITSLHTIRTPPARVASDHLPLVADLRFTA